MVKLSQPSHHSGGPTNETKIVWPPSRQDRAAGSKSHAIWMTWDGCFVAVIPAPLQNLSFSSRSSLWSVCILRFLRGISSEFSEIQRGVGLDSCTWWVLKKKVYKYHIPHTNPFPWHSSNTPKLGFHSKGNGVRYTNPVALRQIKQCFYHY